MRAAHALLAGAAMAFFLVLPVSADLPGTVQGAVVNGSKGRSPVPGLEITLSPSGPEIQLAGLPVGTAGNKAASDNLKLAGVVLVPLALGAGLVFFMKRSPSRMRPAPADAPVQEEKLRLLEALAALDDRYHAGSIPEPEYQRLRDEKKRKLAELW